MNEGELLSFSLMSCTPWIPPDPAAGAYNYLVDPRGTPQRPPPSLAVAFLRWSPDVLVPMGRSRMAHAALQSLGRF